MPSSLHVCRTPPSNPAVSSKIHFQSLRKRDIMAKDHVSIVTEDRARGGIYFGTIG